MFEQFLENKKKKKSSQSLFTLGDLGEGLDSIEIDLGESLKKAEESKHKGVSSKAKEKVG